MARSSFKYEDVRKLQRNLKKLQEEQDAFIEQLAKNLTARLLTKVINRTPVGKVDGGTLRRGWGSTKDFKIYHFGDTFVIEITNPVEYASYVEFGHRKSRGRGWVQGQFMLTISEDELQRDSPKIIEAKLKKRLGEMFR